MRSLIRDLKTICVVMILIAPGISGADDSASNKDSSAVTNNQDVVPSEKTVDELARELSVPLAAFTSLGLGIEYKTYQGSIPGADDQKSWGYFLQAVLPFSQKNGKGFVFRFALPYFPDQPIYWADKGHAEWRIRQEDPTLHEGGYWAPTHGHTDDMTTDLVYGGISETGFILMYGLAGVLPTTSDTSNGKQQLILGPELNIGKVTDWGVYGALISHVVDVVEKKDKGTPDTSITTIQAYFSYDLSNGWQLYSSPTIIYDWEGDSGNKLNLPVGGGFAKTTRIGKMPLRVSAEIQKYVASTDRFGPDWLLKLNFIPVFPNKYTRN